MARCVFTLLAMAALVHAGAAVPKTFYVAPNGSDATGDGSIGNPWATITMAQLTIRPLLIGMSGDITVLLRGGSFAINETIEFTPQDSGRDGFYVTYASYPGEAAVLEGGVPLSGWSVFDAAHNVWAAPLPAGLAPRDVYIGGDRMNETYTGNATLYGYKLLSAADTVLTAWGYVSNNSDLVAAAQAQEAVCAGAATPAGPLRSAGAGSGSSPCAGDVEFLYRMVGCQWVEDRIRVEAWSLLPGPYNGAPGPWVNVSFPQPGWFIQTHKTYKNDFPSTVINTHASLTRDAGAGGWGGVPGTGYVSLATGRVFYVPRPGDDMAALSAWVPALDGPFIRAVGDRDASPAPAFVAALRFQGLTFTHAGWSYPSGACGYAPDQSGVYFDCADAPALPYHAAHAVPGALELHTAQDVQVSGCVFAHLGATGVTAEDGSQDIVIADSVFTDMGCHAVRFGQVDDWNRTDAGTWNARLTLNNSVVYGTGAVLRDCSAVMGGYISDSVVAHNTVSEAQWAGVTIGWGWGDPARPTLGGNAVHHNAVARVNIGTADGGPLYMLGGQASQSEMHHNYVGHAMHHAALVYHDEGSTLWYTHDNVVDQTPEDMAQPNGGWWWAFLAAWAPSEHNILMVNHTTRYLNRSDIYAGNNLTVLNTTYLPAGAPWPPAAQAVIDGAGARLNVSTAGVGAPRAHGLPGAPADAQRGGRA